MANLTEEIRVLETLKGGYRLVERANGRRVKIKFERCHGCKEEYPYTMFQGAMCFKCKGVTLAPTLPRYTAVRAGRAVSYASKRYAALRQATPKWVDPKALRQVFADAKRISKETDVLHHVDHIWPLIHESFCGLNVPWNLRIITDQHNMSKSNAPPLDYLQQITYP